MSTVIDLGPHFWLYFTLLMSAGALLSVLLTLLLEVLLPDKLSRRAAAGRPLRAVETDQNTGDRPDQHEGRPPTAPSGHRLAS